MAVIFYHENCVDGLTAASCLYTAIKGAKCFPVDYGKPLPLYGLEAEIVYFVDFMPTKEMLNSVLGQDPHIVEILDHHVTNKHEHAEQGKRVQIETGVFLAYDEHRSGAALAFDQALNLAARYYDGLALAALTKRTRLVQLVEDYDLWNHRYADTKPFNCYAERFVSSFGVFYDRVFCRELEDSLKIGENLFEQKCALVAQVPLVKKTEEYALYFAPVSLRNEVAGKCKDRPVIVVADCTTGKASIRTDKDSGVSAREFFEKLKERGLVQSGGGHENAIGVVGLDYKSLI